MVGQIVPARSGKIWRSKALQKDGASPYGSLGLASLLTVIHNIKIHIEVMTKSMFYFPIEVVWESTPIVQERSMARFWHIYMLQHPCTRKSIFSLLSWFWKIEVCLWDDPSVCVSTTIKFWNNWTNLYETRRVHIGPQLIWTTYFINPSLETVCLYVYPLSLLGNGSVDKYQWQRIHAIVEELLEAFSIRYMLHQKKVGY